MVLKVGYLEGTKIVVTGITMVKDEAETNGPILDEILQSVEKM
jgi:hypothetical protein